MTNGSEPLAAPPPLPTAPKTTAPKTWGYFATFGWSLLAYLIASVVAFALLYLWDPVTFRFDIEHSDAMKSARYVGLTTVVTNVFLVGLLIGVVWIARATAKDYLALSWPSRQEVTAGLISLVILLPALDALAYLVGQPIIPPFVIDVYKSAQSTGSLPLLWLAIVVAAPVAEEIIFRGFIFHGWVPPTAQRPMIGILFVTALFTVIHIQYNWFGLLQVFMIGLLLTWTRWRSGSTLLPMLMHVIANFYAMMQAVVYFRWFV
ncbi:MAG: CPBP family intramembrane metalloprotease [Xanthobacteraceae bacterium]|nr:CPBP family intramembrane metalloprotease [Xanthobacteraceae bacterium]